MFYRSCYPHATLLSLLIWWFLDPGNCWQIMAIHFVWGHLMEMFPEHNICVISCPANDSPELLGHALSYYQMCLFLKWNLSDILPFVSKVSHYRISSQRRYQIINLVFRHICLNIYWFLLSIFAPVQCLRIAHTNNGNLLNLHYAFFYINKLHMLAYTSLKKVFIFSWRFL